jgi:hypothetical protein
MVDFLLIDNSAKLLAKDRSRVQQVGLTLGRAVFAIRANRAGLGTCLGSPIIIGNSEKSYSNGRGE